MSIEEEGRRAVTSAMTEMQMAIQMVLVVVEMADKRLGGDGP